MDKVERFFEPWIQFSIMTSLCWLPGFMLGSLFGDQLADVFPEIIIVLLVGVISGAVVSVVGWILLRSEVIGFRHWVSMNVLGISAALVASFAILVFDNSLSGYLLGGFSAGGIAGIIQSRSIGEHHKRPGMRTTVMLSWTLALLIGSLIVGKGAIGSDLLDISTFFTSYLLGWIVIGILLIFLLICLLPSPKSGYPYGRIRWWY
ncbi:MAG: hypothetical protein GTO14_23420 [Anaerolineales bacterium]|nr:hypothetical protein [Anaerolineales bacterium]